ncbi:MAG TPA: TIGR03960 family B12-binding radical SAM protein [Dehalococcoidia bacterium]|nr:TIGR03960 family B12-binding radical SAM protein [Dehalococcoidia bacterium]
MDIELLLSKVIRPARYTDGEWNAVVKDWDQVRVRFALAYPDIYDVGMGNLGLMVLYAILNAIPDVAAERVYAPWADMEEAMREAGVPLLSLETRRPLSEFDLIGFTLTYELTYTNVLNMLDLAGLPPLAEERGEGCPLVVAAGPGALNPEPLSPFIDAFLLGDGEEAAVEIADLLRDWKAQGGGREGLLGRLAALPGVYVPRFYRVAYGPEGAVESITPTDAAAPARVALRTLAQLPPCPARPVVPYISVAQERAVLEIGRGYGDGCRRCPGGLGRRPLLMRSEAEIVAAAREILANTGYRELYLIPPCGIDGLRLGEIVAALRRELGEEITLSLPPLPVDWFSDRLAQALLTRGRTGVALNVGAGSERLRSLMGMPAAEEEVLRAAEVAYSHGFTALRLDFMVGLPTEGLDDVKAIGLVSAKAREIGRRYHGARARVRANVQRFVPRPHTPFQWARWEGAEELAPRYAALRPLCRRAGVELAWPGGAIPLRGSPGPGGTGRTGRTGDEQSLLMAMIARGDRRLGAAIYRAWRRGCRLESWREYYRWDLWLEALAEENLAPAFYTQRDRGPDEVLPWAHIDAGADTASLWEEWQRMLQG